MPNTPNRGYPYPAGTVAPNGPLAFEELGDAVDADVEAIDIRLTDLEADYAGHAAGTAAAVPLAAGFLNQDAQVPLETARHGTLVVLSGRVVRTTDGTADGATLVGTVPAGFRPRRQENASIIAYNGLAGTSFPLLRIAVSSAGAINLTLLDGSTWDSRHWIPINMAWRVNP